jgi:riboflavin kinase / FMN adenylyltransferase
VELIRGIANLRPKHRGAVVTLGSFDGLHLGHRALIERTLARAGEAARPAMMLTFEPMPREYLAKGPPPARLTDFRERWRALERTGLDFFCVLRFNEALRSLSGEQFLDLLTQRLHTAGVVVGHDFKFGHNGAANAASLALAAERHGFTLAVVPPVLLDGARISSSAVRAALEQGDFEGVRRLLGRSFAMCGRVMPGQRLGRKLGYPTANIRVRRLRPPIVGIFAVWVRGVPGRAQPMRAVASLGTRPTVDGVEPILEAHIFDYDGDLYGRELAVEFVAKLRDEVRFADLEALTRQMHRDAEQARAILAA